MSTVGGVTTLTEFLLARIAEDEAALDDDGRSLGFHVITVAAGNRWLAECGAKRRIVELHPLDPYSGGCPRCDHDEDGYARYDEPCDTLLVLALPYADHQDYRPEWKKWIEP